MPPLRNRFLSRRRKIVMGDIGKEQEPIWVVPISTPIEEPAPVKEPVKEPVREPART
jgi:hypothetical protein